MEDVVVIAGRIRGGGWYSCDGVGRVAMGTGSRGMVITIRDVSMTRITTIWLQLLRMCDGILIADRCSGSISLAGPPGYGGREGGEGRQMMGIHHVAARRAAAAAAQLGR